MRSVSRKNFLKLSLLGLLGAGFSPGFQLDQSSRIQSLIGRIAADDKIIPIHKDPSYESDVVRETVFDELLHLYYEIKVNQEELTSAAVVPGMGWLSTGGLCAADKVQAEPPYHFHSRLWQVG